MKISLHFIPFLALVCRIHSEPCSQSTKLWIIEVGIECKDTSIVDGKLLVDSDYVNITFIKFPQVSHIPTIPGGIFSRFINLQELDLGSCHVEEIEPSSFTGLIKLRYLNLVENQIRTIPSLAFETLNQLDKLDLGHNNISEIKSDSFKGLTRLTVMYLRNNAIKDIPAGSFDDLVLLEGFYIDYNDLEELGPNILHKSKKVLEIDFSHNNLSKIDPDALKGLTNLRHLYLNHNNLHTLPVRVFSDLSSLERLRLWHNSITDFEIGTFEGLHKLQILELEQNKLKVIHENTFIGLVRIERLELQDNEISSFDMASILKQFQSLTSIKIDHNHWKCRDLKNFTEALEDRGIEFEGGSSYKSANVDGIRCTNENAYHEIPEQVLNFTDSNLDQYLNEDFQNSSLYQFLNESYKTSNFVNYLENGFKESNLYKFLNQNFANSSFYNYFSNHQASEPSNVPKSEAFQSVFGSSSHDSNYLTLVTVGIIVLVLGLILLLVVFRWMHKRRADDKQILLGQTRENHELSSIEVA